jgi:HTH-type transcriptional regulator/antitoxin HigA
MKDIKPIRTEEDFHNALNELEELFDAPKGTADNDRADILVTLIDKYEFEHYPMVN